MGCGSSIHVFDRTYVNEPNIFKNSDEILRDDMYKDLGSQLSPFKPRLKVEIPINNSPPITIFQYRY